MQNSSAGTHEEGVRECLLYVLLFQIGKISTKSERQDSKVSGNRDQMVSNSDKSKRIDVQISRLSGYPCINHCNTANIAAIYLH